MAGKNPYEPDRPEEPTGKYNSGRIPWATGGRGDLADRFFAADKLPEGPLEEEPPEEAPLEEAPLEEELPEELMGELPEEPGAVEEPTRPIGEFDRRAWTLLGSAQPAEETPSPEPAPEELPPEIPEALTADELQEEERDYRPVRFRRDYRLGCLGGVMYATFVICLSVLLACVGWMAASDLLALNKPALTAEVTLPEDIFTEETVDVEDEDGNVTGTEVVKTADMDAVARLLKDYGLINYKWLFKLYSGLSHAERKVDPGTYELNTTYDYRALVKKMQVGSDSQLQTKITFPEGFTMAQIFARLEENGICSRENLYAAAAEAEYSYSFLSGLELGDPTRLEGFLFPDTYYFFEGMQASSVLNKFLSNFHYKLTAEMLQTMYDRGLTFREVVTIASIIEKEAANDEERYLISSVIHNRLAQGMPLQMDSTVLYGCGVEDATEVTGTMLGDAENLYNTYIYAGLTPSPICNPGAVSLRAALYPRDTQYLYFALDENTGTHQFFIFLGEFQNFVATQSYGQEG